MTIKRSMVFIDGANLLSGWNTYQRKVTPSPELAGQYQKITRKRISFKPFINELTKNTDFIIGYYYDATQFPISHNKQKFYDSLRSLEITICTKKLRYKNIVCRHCNQVDENIAYQKGVDVALVTEAMSLAFERAYDVAIIVSGDNDFVDAINFIKTKGLKVWVVSYKSCLGDDIMRVADRVIRLDDISGKITEHDTRFK